MNSNKFKIDIYKEILTHLDYDDIISLCQIDKKLCNYLKINENLLTIINNKFLINELDKFTDYYGKYSFIPACKLGIIKFVEMLLKNKNIDPSLANNEAILNACEYGHCEIVKILLKDSRISIDVYYNLPFKLAFENKHLEVCDELLRYQKNLYII